MPHATSKTMISLDNMLHLWTFRTIALCIFIGLGVFASIANQPVSVKSMFAGLDIALYFTIVVFFIIICDRYILEQLRLKPAFFAVLSCVLLALGCINLLEWPPIQDGAYYSLGGHDSLLASAKGYYHVLACMPALWATYRCAVPAGRSRLPMYFLRGCLGVILLLACGSFLDYAGFAAWKAITPLYPMLVFVISIALWKRFTFSWMIIIALYSLLVTLQSAMILFLYHSA